MIMKNYAHQGDIVFAPFEGEIVGKQEKHSGSYIVGYGEATGHHHMVKVADPTDLEIVKVAGGFIMRLKSEGVVEHQEHKPIRLAPGTYRIGHEREMDWFALSSRIVRD